MSVERLKRDFYLRDVLKVAPGLIGKKLVLSTDGTRTEWIISEVEAYRGEEDLACHASKGRTKRTDVMFGEGGHLYMYLIYGMYWMLNIVTGPEDVPHAVLIRGLEGLSGPGRLTRKLGLDGSFYGESLITSKRIWLEDSEKPSRILITPRIGIDYAGEWKERPWRFVMG